MISRAVLFGLLVAGLAAPLSFSSVGEATAQTATDLKCKGCVGKKDIGKNAVKEKNIKKNAVTSAKIKDGTVESSDIKDGTIQAEDIADGVLGGSPVGDVRQILSGGFNQGGAFTNGFTGPGWTTTLSPNYPDSGEGEAATQIRMVAGTLKNLRVHVQTQNVPSSGSLTLTVRINGANTALTCTVTATGDCTSTASVSINDNDRLALEITNSFPDEGNWTLTYSIQYM